MEDTTEFKLPVFEKPKKGPKKIEKELLPRINREVPCAYCETIKTLNPDQYQKRFDYFGSADAIGRHFKCQECETKEQTNPFLFWLTHSEVFYNVVRELRPVFQDILDNKIDIPTFISRNNEILNRNKIFAPNFDLQVENGRPVGFKINFPMIGNLLIYPLEHWKEKKIVFENLG